MPPRPPRPGLLLAAVDAAMVAAGAGGLYLFARTGPGRVVARLFAPGFGIAEDPATGSAAGPLGAYLAEHAGHTGELLIAQGDQVGRPSLLRVDVDDEVWVSGRVHVVGEGAFELAEDDPGTDSRAN